MKCNQIKDIGNEKFRRLIGVKVETFENMLKILSNADKKRNQKEDVEISYA